MSIVYIINDIILYEDLKIGYGKYHHLQIHM